MGREIATADARLACEHPRIAVAGIAGIIFLVGIGLTVERVARQEVNMSGFRNPAPLPPAARDQWQKVARLLYVPGEKPDIAESTSVLPLCAADFTTADGVTGRFTVDRQTGRLIGFSCPPAHATVRLQEKRGPVRTEKEATTRARNYLAAFLPEETRDIRSRVERNSPTTWHVVLASRSGRFLLTIHAPTGALLLLNRYQSETDVKNERNTSKDPGHRPVGTDAKPLTRTAAMPGN